MTRHILAIFWLVAAAGATVVAQTEPVLNAINMPKYPALAYQARVEGTVKLTFTLAANVGEPKNVVVVSGPPMLTEAALENLQTWKFENPYAVERKYETTFRYQLGMEVPFPGSPTVTFKSFYQVDIVADVPQKGVE